MPVETAIWKMTDGGPVALTYERLDFEARLEDMVVTDSALIGLDVLVIGRQLATAYRGFVDILAVDKNGQLCCSA